MANKLLTDVKLVKIEEIIPYFQNTKDHPDTQVKDMSTSIKKFNFDPGSGGGVRNEVAASSAVVRAFTSAKIEATERFPELKGEIYSNLNKITEGRIKNASVAGFYSPSEKKITISTTTAKSHYASSKKLGRGVDYLYPHDYPNNWVQQQYMPDPILGKEYYVPSQNFNEHRTAEFWKNIDNNIHLR